MIIKYLLLIKMDPLNGYLVLRHRKEGGLLVAVICENTTDSTTTYKKIIRVFCVKNAAMTV